MWKGSMSLLKNILTFCIPIVMLLGIDGPKQRLPEKQYQVKAAFLYNFTQFVEWPDSAFSEANAPLIIGVVGEDHFGSYLEEVVAGEQMNGHPLIVKRFNDDEEITTCHILFVSVKSKNNSEKIIERTKGKSILTVSDIPTFLQNGGMIRFISVNNKIQFQINPGASISADLKISSKLLRLAEIVTPNE